MRRPVPLALTLALAVPAAAQAPEWVRIADSSHSLTGEHVAVVPDGSGDVVVAGEFNVSFAGDLTVFSPGEPDEVTHTLAASGGAAEVFVARYGADGELRWVVVQGNQNRDSVHDLTVLADGSVLLCGAYNGRNSNSGVSPFPVLDRHGVQILPALIGSYVIRYDATGEFVWAETYATSSSGNLEVHRCAATEDGGFMTANFAGSVTSRIRKFDAAGALQWTKQTAACRVLEVMPHTGGFVVLGEVPLATASSFTLSTGLAEQLVVPAIADQNQFLASYENGQWVWVRRFGRVTQSGGNPDYEYYAARSPVDGAVYVTGSMQGLASTITLGEARFETTAATTTVPFQAGAPNQANGQFYLARYEHDGALAWVEVPRQSTDSSAHTATPRGIAVLPDGAAVVTGRMSSNGNESIVFGASGPNPTTLAWNRSVSWHVVFEPAGAVRFADLDEVGIAMRGVDATADGAFCLTGSYGGTNRTLCSGKPYATLMPAAQAAFFLARIDDGGVQVEIEVPADIQRHCEAGLMGANVYFVVGVHGAPPAGARLVITDTSTSTVLADVTDPPASVGVGPVFFGMGTRTIAVSLRTAAAEEIDAGAFAITVEDTTPPVISAPAAVTIEAQGVTTPIYRTILGATVADDCDPDPALTFDPDALPLGTHNVRLIATDDAGNTSDALVAVTVADTIPPVFTVCPTDIERDCTGPQGALVTFDVLAEDAHGVTSLVCTTTTNVPVDPAGTLFPHGTTVVVCAARDASGNVATCTFAVTIVDNSTPVIVAPDDIVVPTAPGESFALVTFAVTATTLCDPHVPVVCTAPWGEVRSGDAFPVGTTTVVCTATAHNQTQATATFHVTVRDLEPPVIDAGAGQVTLVTDCGGSSLAVAPNLLGVSATDNSDPDVELSCAPAIVGPGATIVTVTARDQDGNETSVPVTVNVLRGAFTCEILRPLEPAVDNRINPGRVVPIKLRVRCDGALESGVGVTIAGIDVLGADGTPVAHEPVEDAGLSSDNGSAMVWTGDHFRYNLATAGFDASSGRRFRVRILIQEPGHVDTHCQVVLINR